MSASDRILGSTFAGRYRVVRKLGEGGMGAVFDAVDGQGTHVALKVIHQEVAAHSPEAAARFLQETRASATLRSPHIVSVIDSGIDARLDTPFLVMELLEGGDVRSLLERTGPLEPSVAVRIAVEAARGLAVAHEAGVVHRDVKPENLFLGRSADGGVVVKVCDFGIAKVSGAGGEQLTKTGHLLGSVLYMSPEQSRSSKHVDARSDVWSLAVTLYELLSGKTPHPDAPSLAQILLAITTTEPAHLQDHAPWIEPELVVAVHRGLVRDVDLRCPSMALFCASLARFAGGALTESSLVAASDDTRGRAQPRAILDVWRDAEAADDAAQDHLVGSLLAKRYRLRRQLGRGGMGAVYEARAETESRDVAVKVILAATGSVSGEARRRFVREARAAASIDSAHVVTVLDADTDPVSSAPFIVMELLSGIDLDHLVRDRGPIEPATIVKLFLQACEGLSAAHARSLVHRDIKPANLFLHQAEGEVVLKLCDFGVAKNTNADAIEGSTAGLTRTGGLLGSPLYMSPEQAKNAKRVDHRSDVWSLCLAMYEALTGARPWPQCTTIGELILAICTESIAPMTDLAPWVPPELAAIVERGLLRPIDERWPSVDALAAALRPLADGDTRVTTAMLRSVSEDARARASKLRRLVDVDAATIEQAPPPDEVSPRSDSASSSAEESAGRSHAGLSIPVAAQSGEATAPRAGLKRGTGQVVAAAAAVLLLGTGGAFAASEPARRRHRSRRARLRRRRSAGGGARAAWVEQGGSAEPA